MKKPFTLAATLALGILLGGIASIARADSMDSASDIGSAVAAFEKEQKGEDGMTPLDKDHIKKIQKELRARIGKARKAADAEEASWKKDKDNPPQHLSDHAMHLWGDGMNTRKARFEGARKLLDELEARIDALPDIKPEPKKKK